MTPRELISGRCYFGGTASFALASAWAQTTNRLSGVPWREYRRLTTWSARKIWLASRETPDEELPRKYDSHLRRLRRRLGHWPERATEAAAYAAYHSGRNRGPAVAVGTADAVRAIRAAHMLGVGLRP